MRSRDEFLGQYRNQNLATVALEKAARVPDEVAIYLEDGEHVRYGSIVEEARRLAAALNTLGLGRNDVISFQLPNWRESVAIDIAACLLGLVLNPVIPIYRDREVTFILEDTSARTILIPDQFRGFDYPRMLNRLRADLPSLEHIVVVRPQSEHEDMLTYDELIEAANPEDFDVVRVDPDEVKIVMYTSGTTGRAKAVQHSHNTMTRALDQGCDGWGLGEGDVMLMPSPVTHITGFVIGIELPFFSEAKSAFMERWDVDQAMTLIDRLGASACVSATPFLQELVQRASEAEAGLPSMRIFALRRCFSAACADSQGPPGV